MMIINDDNYYDDDDKWWLYNDVTNIQQEGNDFSMHCWVERAEGECSWENKCWRVQRRGSFFLLATEFFSWGDTTRLYSNNGMTEWGSHQQKKTGFSSQSSYLQIK